MTERTKLRVLVCGGGGAQGGPVVERLLERGHEARILGRHREKVGSLIRKGATFVQGDLGDRQSLIAACKDIDSVFFHLPIDAWPPKAYRYIDNMLAAVAEAGVKHLVYTTSGAIVDEKVGVLFIDLKSEFAKRVRNAAIPATILMPPVFLDNLLAPFCYPDVRFRGALVWPYTADAPCSWITLEDHARHVVAALEHPELAGRTLRIACSDVATGPEIAAEFSRVLRRPVRYEPQSATSFVLSASPLLGMAAGLALAQVYRYHRRKGSGMLVVGDAAETSRLLGLEPFSLAQSVDRILAPRAIAVHGDTSRGNVLPQRVKKLALEDAIFNRGQLINMFVEPETSDQTLCTWYGYCRRGVGPPVHIHTLEHEAFYITRGKVTVGIEDNVYTAGKGEFVFLPANRPHWFMPVGGHAEMLGITVPARGMANQWKGQGGMFRETGAPATCLALPPYPSDPADVSALIRVANEYGIEILEPNPLVMAAAPSFLARTMRRLGGRRPPATTPA